MLCTACLLWDLFTNDGAFSNGKIDRPLPAQMRMTTWTLMQHPSLMTWTLLQHSDQTTTLARQKVCIHMFCETSLSAPCAVVYVWKLYSMVCDVHAHVCIVWSACTECTSCCLIRG